ncbi:hypothetical protein [Bradyrhizobium sp.]|uniref:hypothetical protein n=1 Tax=Bradyrhizobium sp. TaxID=376 RepID=UPI002B64F8FE|nr:hypothetical protein [Bradyrhizobium sp.]HMM91884.1 hypothetical protein [Bradyrhizobium sp.]
MRHAARPSPAILAVALLIALASGSVVTHAQSGSAGGSIGNEEKSLSGSREPPRANEQEKQGRSKPDADESRPSKKGGGGGTHFDGAWIVRSRGVTCQGTGSNAVVVTSGKIIGQNARGTVSPDGRVYATTNDGGITVITTGRLSGRSGGGTFRQSDGCTGNWTASKQ